MKEIKTSQKSRSLKSTFLPEKITYYENRSPRKKSSEIKVGPKK